MLKKTIIAAALASFVCGTNSVNAQELPNEFASSLQKYYQELSQAERQEGDIASANIFSYKANNLYEYSLPEDVAVYDISRHDINGNKSREELANYRIKLIDALNSGVRNSKADLAAYTQTRFDCWVEETEQHEAGPCRGQFIEALNKLNQPIAAPIKDPVVVAEPVSTPSPAPRKVSEQQFIVYFDLNKYNLDARDLEIIRSAADYSGSSPLEVIVSGYTDTTASEEYNMRLSEKRSARVAEQLQRYGVNAEVISAYAYGELNLAEQTADNTKSKKNRRAEVVVRR